MTRSGVLGQPLASVRREVPVPPTDQPRNFTSDSHKLLHNLTTSAEDLASGPFVVHSDLVHAGRVLEQYPGRVPWLTAHLEVLANASSGRSLWMPTFHYAFTRTGRFDTLRHPSEVGVLTERFRTHIADWRTAVPVFSFSGTGVPPAVDDTGTVDPFDDRSVFAEMVRQDAILVFFGASFSSSTIKHHVERRTGGPIYRYDKDFPGAVTLVDGTVRSVVLHYHVRPLTHRLTYDDERLLREAEDADVVRLAPASEPYRLIAASARRLVAFWEDRLDHDPFYFLDEASRSWAEPLMQHLGRRFELRDFEGPAPIKADT